MANFCTDVSFDTTNYQPWQIFTLNGLLKHNLWPIDCINCALFVTVHCRLSWAEWFCFVLLMTVWDENLFRVVCRIVMCRLWPWPGHQRQNRSCLIFTRILRSFRFIGFAPTRSLFLFVIWGLSRIKFKCLLGMCTKFYSWFFNDKRSGFLSCMTQSFFNLIVAAW